MRQTATIPSAEWCMQKHIFYCLTLPWQRSKDTPTCDPLSKSRPVQIQYSREIESSMQIFQALSKSSHTSVRLYLIGANALWWRYLTVPFLRCIHHIMPPSSWLYFLWLTLCLDVFCLTFPEEIDSID